MPQGPQPNCLSHFAINAEDCDRAAAFYQSVFGWTFQPWGPPGFFRTEVGNLHGAIQQKQEEPFPTFIGGFECTIAVEDVDQTLELIVANGGEVTMAKVTIPTVCELARVKDSEGNGFSVARYF